MKDNKITNILLTILIVLVGIAILRPGLDGANNAQARDEPKFTRDIQSQGNMAIAKATADVADANEAIAKAIDGLAESVEKAGGKIAGAIEASGAKSE